MFVVVLVVLPGCGKTINDAQQAIENKKYDEAQKILEELSKKGDIEAQFQLGKLLNEHNGSFVESFYWLSKAKDNGSDGSSNYIADISAEFFSTKAEYNGYKGSFKEMASALTNDAEMGLNIEPKSNGDITVRAAFTKTPSGEESFVEEFYEMDFKASDIKINRDSLILPVFDNWVRMVFAATESDSTDLYLFEPEAFDGEITKDSMTVKLENAEAKWNSFEREVERRANNTASFRAADLYIQLVQESPSIPDYVEDFQEVDLGMAGVKSLKSSGGKPYYKVKSKYLQSERIVDMTQLDGSAFDQHYRSWVFSTLNMGSSFNIGSLVQSKLTGEWYVHYLKVNKSKENQVREGQFSDQKEVLSFMGVNPDMQLDSQN